ncbi:PAH-inducible cytochrome P450 monooxygenase PC-PAH 4 [Earliella scabrosa]|nr:PAH-inducible cytochrome P450 monooxygenase PC-PAH 4 [Earliella scabrosa]
MSLHPLLLPVGCVIVLVVLIDRAARRRNLKKLRGPPSASLLFGNEFQIFHQRETGALDFQWMHEYGATWRTAGYFGADQLMTTDPKALQHILQKSGYNYPKRTDMNHMTYLLLGPGILWSPMHQRYRKVMNPAFSQQQVRDFVPAFQRNTGKLMEKWRSMIAEKPDDAILVNRWLIRSGLDIIGETAFDYNFGALDDLENPLAKEFATLNTDCMLYPDAVNMFYRSLWQYLPSSILKITRFTPSRVYARCRRMNAAFAKIGQPLYFSNAGEPLASREGKKDLMSVLVRANASENERTRLTTHEVLAQMHHLTSAAQDTTSGTLSWMLYELSKRPDYQARMRAEIRAVRAQVAARGDTDFTPDDLDSMKVVLGAIKETLRFHPIAYHMWRVAAKDDVIPLSEPVIGVDGTAIHEIPIQAGQAIIVSVCGYNRLPSVWGEDADKWNPDRFARLDMDKQVKVGVYANLLTFSAGLRACIGWRFAMYQLQAVTAALLENFEFALPLDKPHIRRGPAGVILPLIDGKEELGAAMPLRVSLAH